MCRIALQRIALLQVYKNPDPKRSDLKNSRSKIGSKNSSNLSREKTENDFHSDYVPCIPTNMHTKEQKHSNLSPFNTSVDLDRFVTHKQKFSDFNDSNLSCFSTLFWTSNFEITYTRPIWTKIFVNLKQSYPLKGDSTHFFAFFVLHALGTSDSKSQVSTQP